MSSYEYTGLTEDQKKVIRGYRDALQCSEDFVRPHFEKAVRYYKLFAGEMPPELDSTFSKCMLWLGMSIVERELPQTVSGILSRKNWFRLSAKDPMMEPHAHNAEKWLNYQIDERQKFASRIIPTIQACHIFGTGYRFYNHRYKTVQQTMTTYDEMAGVPYNIKDNTYDKSQVLIAGHDVSFFNVFPSPVGTFVNDYDDTDDNIVDYVIIMAYPPRSYIENEKAFDQNQVKALLDHKGQCGHDPTEEWKQRIAGTQSGWQSFTMPDWVRRLRNGELMLEDRFRLAYYYQNRPKKLTIVAEDSFILYDGPMPIPHIPLAKFTSTYNLDNWYGIGMIEPCEDLILSMIMNFNHRLDYLAGTLHPPTYVPADLLEELGGDKSVFDPQPYGVIPYNYSRYGNNISNIVYHDRNTDISSQAFMEEDKMSIFMQEITGHPSLFKGQTGPSTGDIGATGIVSLISQGTARTMFRSANVENSGIVESLKLTLAFGDKFINEDQTIPDREGADGWPWTRIPRKAITDKFGVQLDMLGSNQAAEAFKTMIATAPMVLNNPVVKNQVEAMRQLLDKSGWNKIETLLSQPPTGMQQQPPMSAMGNQGQNPSQASGKGMMMGQPGGAPSATNDARSMMNRSTVEANTGRPVAAGNIEV
ncbi:MAG: hypothetical protein K9N51_02445 [Candidatus Pacebacteria bacterium]|nr:hypothetical protein [Candidatus Paceibacterota bacterium]